MTKSNQQIVENFGDKGNLENILNEKTVQSSRDSKKEYYKRVVCVAIDATVEKLLPNITSSSVKLMRYLYNNAIVNKFRNDVTEQSSVFIEMENYVMKFKQENLEVVQKIENKKKKLSSEKVDEGKISDHNWMLMKIHEISSDYLDEKKLIELCNSYFNELERKITVASEGNKNQNQNATNNSTKKILYKGKNLSDNFKNELEKSVKSAFKKIEACSDRNDSNIIFKNFKNSVEELNYKNNATDKNIQLHIQTRLRRNKNTNLSSFSTKDSLKLYDSVLESDVKQNISDRMVPILKKINSFRKENNYHEVGINIKLDNNQSCRIEFVNSDDVMGSSWLEKATSKTVPDLQNLVKSLGYTTIVEHKSFCSLDKKVYFEVGNPETFLKKLSEHQESLEYIKSIDNHSYTISDVEQNSSENRPKSCLNKIMSYFSCDSNKKEPIHIEF